MKEEYLEIEQYDCMKQETPNNNQNEPIEEDGGVAAQKPQQHRAFPPQQLDEDQQRCDVYQTQPTDFDGDNDDQMLRKLLKKFQMSFLYPCFKAYDVTYRSLRFLSVDDINTTIRSVGHRAEFREKLFTWRRKRYRTNDIIIEYERIQPAAISTTDATETTLAPVKIENTTSHEHVPLSAGVSNESELESMSERKQELQINDGNELIDAKRIKFDNFVELRENRINTQLNLQELLNESIFGPVMKTYYAKYGTLERKHRDELIQIIVNYVTTNEIKLHCSDFSKIVDMILNIFPAEEEFRSHPSLIQEFNLQDYYYIHRHGKRNPMGRLYTKYYNTLKRIRVRDIHQEFTQDNSTSYMLSSTLGSDSGQTTDTLTTAAAAKATATETTTTTTTSVSTSRLRPDTRKNANNDCSTSRAVLEAGGNGNSNGNRSTSDTQIELTEDEFQELIQLDDTSVSAIKNFLRCQGLNWNDIKTMWTKTYLSRQEDVEHSTTKDILKEWPKYLNSRGMELFDIDFNLKFASHKLNTIQRKWPHFARKMAAYYQTNIRDEVCKGLYGLFKTQPGKDTEDYIITVLLNAIMIPMARYRDAVGNRRKVSIVEAVDLFAIRVTNLEELDQKREEISIKYGDMHSDYTPLIVVVGDNNINIHEIYVHFDIALYEMPDYLSALDACLKIYRVLNLPFPASNEYIWTFIQRYFYEIQLPDDNKCPSMSTIISYLKF